jgi:hypothetical protein
VWREIGASESAVFARLLDAQGDPVGSDRRVALTETGYDTSPVVVASGDGTGYLVLWVRTDDVSGASEAVARRVDEDGAARGRIKLVAPNAVAVDAALNPDTGEILVVVQTSWTGPTIVSRRVADTGRPTGASHEVAAVGSRPRVVFNEAAGEFAVVFTICSEGASTIHGVRLHGSSGRRVGPVRQVSTAGAFPGASDIAYDTDRDRYVVVWQDARYRGEDPEYFACFDQGFRSVYARVLTAGLRGWTEHQISENPAGTLAMGPGVAYSRGSRELLAAWGADHFEDEIVGGEAIMVRRVRPNGRPVGGERDVSGPQLKVWISGPDLLCPRIREANQGLESVGRCLVVWNDDRGSFTTGDLSNLIARWLSG